MSKNSIKNIIAYGASSLIFFGCSQKWETSGKTEKKTIETAPEATRDVTDQPQNNLPAPNPTPVPNPTQVPNPTPVPTPAPTPNAGTSDPNYVALVGRGFTNYKDIYAPTSQSVTFQNGNIVFGTGHGNLTYLRHRIFIPPGTKKWSVSFHTFGGGPDQTDSKAAARFSMPPISLNSDVTPETSSIDTRRSLSQLVSGQELRFFTPAGSGGISISTPEASDSYQVPQNSGNWIYIHVMSVPGNSILNLQHRFEINQDCYLRWYQKAQWDSDGNPRAGVSHDCN